MTYLLIFLLNKTKLCNSNVFFNRKHEGQSLVCDESVYSEDSGNLDLIELVEILVKPLYHLSRGLLFYSNNLCLEFLLNLNDAEGSMISSHIQYIKSSQI